MRIFIIALALVPVGLIAATTTGTGRGVMLIAYGVILAVTYAAAQVIARLLWIAGQKKKIERAKDEFVSFASHQLRTPLTTMNWRLEMLLAGDAGKLSRAQATYLSEMEDETRRMTELVNTFLNVSRINLGTLAVSAKPCDVSEIITGVLSEFSRSMHKKRIRVNNTASQITISCDQNLLRMVLQNLIANAVKYTHTGGSVTVGARRDGNAVVLSVEDTGIGIPENAQPFIFSKLFRADNARKEQPDGTGIGLYIAKSLIDTAGGRIWFESHAGRGTAFFVSLPADGMRSKTGTAALSFAQS